MGRSKNGQRAFTEQVEARERRGSASVRNGTGASGRPARLALPHWSSGSSLPDAGRRSTTLRSRWRY